MPEKAEVAEEAAVVAEEVALREEAATVAEEAATDLQPKRMCIHGVMKRICLFVLLACLGLPFSLRRVYS